jgi:hypothetical protein
MGGTTSNTDSAFTSRMKNFLDIVEVRQAFDSEELEAIFRLRYQAYRREEFIPSNSSRLCIDELDLAPNKYDFGFYIAGRLVSSMRLHILTKATPYAAAMLAFPDIVQPWLDQGKTFIDPSRFVVDFECSKLYPELPLAMMRLPIMAAQFFHADHGIFCVRHEHVAFYKRVFHSEPKSKFRKFPYVDMSVMLLRTETKNPGKGIFKRYPFFKSNYFEQRALFRETMLGNSSFVENSVVLPV